MVRVTGFHINKGTIWISLSYTKTIFVFTCRPAATSSISLWERSRKLSTRSPSIKPSQDSVFASVVNERQNPCSILPTGLIVCVNFSCSSYRNSNSSLFICVTKPANKNPLRTECIFHNIKIKFQDTISKCKVHIFNNINLQRYPYLEKLF